MHCIYKHRNLPRSRCLQPVGSQLVDMLVAAAATRKHDIA